MDETNAARAFTRDDARIFLTRLASPTEPALRSLWGGMVKFDNRPSLFELLGV
jgi:hypothetical protein